MTVFMWPTGFKIKSKADARRFLEMAAEQPVYWHDDELDYRLEFSREWEPQVATRPQGCRGNIFSPYVVEVDPVQTIWNTRKYINAQIFSDKGW